MSRRWLAWIVCAALFVPVTPHAGATRPDVEVWREARPLMGTLVEIQAEGTNRDALKRAADAAYREMARLVDIMSHYDARSTVSAINRQAGIAPVHAEIELIEVLKMAQRVSEATDGAFDVTIGALTGWRFDTDDPHAPDASTIAQQRALVNYRYVLIDESRGTVFLKRAGMRLDLGGIAKLYIIRAGLGVLKHLGVAAAMIDGGGDIAAMGAERARPWRIAIRHPRRRDATLGVIELREGFVVSSGDYERYFEQQGRRFHHVLDPQTGFPTHGVVHVTLVAPTLECVNGYSAALMVLGDTRAWRLIERTPDLQALLVRADGLIRTTPAVARTLRLPSHLN